LLSADLALWHILPWFAGRVVSLGSHIKTNNCEYCRKQNPVTKENGVIINYQMDGRDLQAALHKYCAAEWCKRLPHVIPIEIAPVE